MTIAVSKEPLLTFVVHELLPGSEPGTLAMRWPEPDSPTVFSLQPDGSIQTRPEAEIGAWESGKRVGDKLIFRADQAVKVFAIVEGV